MDPEERIREMESTIEGLQSQLNAQNRRLEAVEYELERIRDARQNPWQPPEPGSRWGAG
jgi:TolA-binding protein